MSNRVSKHTNIVKDNINFSELSITLKYILIVFMIIGRIEFISILILIKKFVFKN